MLTSDLLRVTKRKGTIKPKLLDVGSEDALERAGALLAIFQDHRGEERGGIDEEVEAAIGHGTDFLIWRGLAKLLYDRSEFEVEAAREPAEIREALFLRASALGIPLSGDARVALLEEVAGELGITAEDCVAGLYADLEARQVLTTFKGMSPEELLNRYNIAQCQGILFRARRLVVTLGAQDSNRLRLFFQMLKFHRLMHRTERVEDGYEVILDGPASLFKKGRKYGLEMAKFLPALLHLDEWSMRAEVEWDGREFTYELDQTVGLKPTRRARGQWVAEEERWFEERFEEKAPEGWRLERRGEVVDLGDNEVLVTDYVLTDPEGREVWVEIVGFWRAGYLKRRVERLSEMEGDAPVVLVVSERLKSDREKIEGSPAQVVFFKGVILHDKVLAAAEAALG